MAKENEIEVPVEELLKIPSKIKYPCEECENIVCKEKKCYRWLFWFKSAWKSTTAEIKKYL